MQSFYIASTWKTNQMRLTKSFIDKIKPPVDQQQVFYRDEQLKGFALRVTKAGAKSFVLEKLIQGKLRRLTIGRYGELTAEQARREAQNLLGQIATGRDPIAEKQAKKACSVTLRETFKDYIQARKDLKPKTIYDYEQLLSNVFPDWLSKPLLSITKDKVVKRHSKTGDERGHACANLAMRVLRALFNFASGQYEDSQGHSLITENPVKRLSQTKAWYRIKRRQTYIKSHELSAWYEGVMQIDNEILRDYLLLILFTGLRRQEAAKLSWSQVDLDAKTLTIHDTKNHETHTLPLSDYLFDLLIKRYQNKTNDYVFSGTGAGGFIVEPKRQIKKIIDTSGISFTIHDLRRTFITIAESLDIPAYALKRLLNHKMTSDVTSGYIIHDAERLRKPMQLITDYILQQTKVIG